MVNNISKAPEKRPSCSSASGITTYELIMVIAIIGILIAFAIPILSPGEDQILESLAKVLISDIAYAREIAIISDKGTQLIIYSGSWLSAIDDESGIMMASDIPHESQKTTSHWFERLSEQTLKMFTVPIALLTSPFVEKSFAGDKKERTDTKEIDDSYYGPGGNIHEDRRLDYEYRHEWERKEPKDITKILKEGEKDEKDDVFVDEDQEDRGWGLRYIEGNYISLPDANFSRRVGIVNNASTVTLNFDSQGKMYVPNYDWSEYENTLIVAILNNLIQIKVSRYTGKAWFEKI
ncbi:MAG: hypothetical protein HQ568_10500 [Calditrichaeota bacterium]|nr:hypothetical protein [Calditrichota bacterium]